MPVPKLNGPTSVPVMLPAAAGVNVYGPAAAVTVARVAVEPLSESVVLEVNAVMLVASAASV